jgi:hypothetical protein
VTPTETDLQQMQQAVADVVLDVRGLLDEPAFRVAEASS